MPAGQITRILSAFAALAWAITASPITATAGQAERPVTCEEGSPPEPIRLFYGNHTTNCEIDENTDSDTFDFSGEVGDMVRFVLHTPDFMDPRMEVRDPSGTIIVDESCSGGCLLLEERELTVSGEYRITVTERDSDENGDYSLQIEIIPPPYDIPRLAYGEGESDTTDPRVDQDFFYFDALAGTEVRVVVSTSAFLDPRLEIFAPGTFDVPLADVSCSGGCSVSWDNEGDELTQSGEYLVIVSERDSDETGSYQVGLQCNFGSCPANPPPDIAVGLNPAGQGWSEIMDDMGGLRDWVQVDWSAYNSGNGETRPAWCDVDGDLRHELVLGLGPFPANGGWLEVKDDAQDGFAHLAWIRVPWGAYNSANGETWPACGDVDGDMLDEIVAGLGGETSSPHGQGWFYVFDDALASYAGHSSTPGGDGWLRLGWPSYNSSVGETRPAVGDLDSDSDEEIVLGLATGAAGWVQILDDAGAGFAPLPGAPVAGGWLQLDWPAYNSSNGESWIAVCDLDDDDNDEVVVCPGENGSGWCQIRDSASGFDPPVTPAGDGWFQLDWGAYNSANGSLHPSCGNLDSDVPEELLLGLGSYPDDATGAETGGWLELKNDLDAALGHLDWWRVHWPDYNDADGLTRPAIAR